jgi:hypothetical protein
MLPSMCMRTLEQALKRHGTWYSAGRSWYDGGRTAPFEACCKMTSCQELGSVFCYSHLWMARCYAWNAASMMLNMLELHSDCAFRVKLQCNEIVL